MRVEMDAASTRNSMATPVSLGTKFKRMFPRHMIVLSVVVGLLGGYGAVGFRKLIEYLLNVWPVDGFSSHAIAGLDWYWVVGIPAAGGIIVGSITRWFAPEAKGHGVPEVMEAVALRDGAIRPRVVVAKAFASSVCIASGGSVGREGPIAQIGAAIGSSIGQALGVGRRKLRTLVGCGAAAGIAATFNAPVAGALFAVEVLLGDFAVHQFSPIVISSVVATVVARQYVGDIPAFEIPAAQLESYRLVHPGELLGYACLGVLAGILAIAFVRTLCFAEDRVEQVKLPLPVTAAIGGALVGSIALVFPDVLGVGYEAIGQTLEGATSWQLLVGLLGAKLVAVCITLGSGGSGGVFAPSLFLGAMLGGLVGFAVHAIDPTHSAPSGAYALVGMGAVVAATTRAPITTILRRGVDIRAGQDVNVLRSIPVRDVLRTAPTAAASSPVRELLDRVVQGDLRSLYVVDEHGHFGGVVSMRELKSVLHQADALGDLVVAADLANMAGPSVELTDSLDRVLERLDLGYRDELPVLEGRRLAGVVRIEDVLVRYRREIATRDVPIVGEEGSW